MPIVETMSLTSDLQSSRDQCGISLYYYIGRGMQKKGLEKGMVGEASICNIPRPGYRETRLPPHTASYHGYPSAPRGPPAGKREET